VARHGYSKPHLESHDINTLATSHPV